MVDNRQKIIIETPEKIYFTYTLAEVGTRAAAYTIDLLIQVGVLIVFGILGFFSFFNSENLKDEGLLTVAIFYILIFFFQWFYFVFFEIVLNGVTPGKKICKIRVIRYNGERLDLASIVLRNLLRAADSLPFAIFNVLGGFVAIINKKNRRLGDMVSGTLVVVDEGINIVEPDFETTFVNTNKPTITKLNKNNMLSEKDLYILRKILNDRSINPISSGRSAKLIIDKLDNKYDLTIFKDKNYFEIIEEIYKAHTYEN